MNTESIGITPSTGIELSIICVNWNSLDYLLKAIASIYEFTRGISFEIVVVDNASPDGMAPKLKEAFPKVKLLLSQENLGFASANNLGFKHSSGTYVLFLNPDTQLIDSAIETMLFHAKRLSDVGVVGCKLLNSDLSIQMSCIQTFPTILNQLFDVEYLQRKWPHWKIWQHGPLLSGTTVPQPVEVVSGACILVKREIFEKVGMFSEDYFMYADDVDLCYKTQQSGFTNYYVGEASIIHHGGKSSSQRAANQWSVMMKFNSVFKFCVNTRGRLYGWAYRISMILCSALRIVVISLLSFFDFVSGSQESLVYARTKWISVLKWSVGLDSLISSDR